MWHHACGRVSGSWADGLGEGPIVVNNGGNDYGKSKEACCCEVWGWAFLCLAVGHESWAALELPLGKCRWFLGGIGVLGYHFKHQVLVERGYKRHLGWSLLCVEKSCGGRLFA